MQRRAFLTALAASPLFAPSVLRAAPTGGVPTIEVTEAAQPLGPVSFPADKKWPIAAQYYPREVRVRRSLAVGSIIVVSPKFYLYHIIGAGRAMRYGVAVGRSELVFRGQATIQRKVEWPSWTPTPEMMERSPEKYLKYKDGMPGGPQNPLGPRAMYLYQDGHDTAIRIHGTLEPSSIGHNASNGCLRMVNDHVMALFAQVPIGTPVTVY